MHEALLMGEGDHLTMSFLPLGCDTFTAKENVLGAGETRSVIQSINQLLFQRTRAGFPAPTGLLTAVCDFSPIVSASSSGAWQAPQSGGIKQAKDPHMYEMVKWFWAPILSYKCSCTLHFYPVSVSPVSLFLRPFLATCMQQVPPPERIRSGVSDTNRTQYLAGSSRFEKIRIG